MRDMFELTERLKALPPYLFAKIDQIKNQEIQKGRRIINLGVGDPDLATPDFIIEEMVRAARNPKNHQYPSYQGMLEFRQAVAQWYEERFLLSLDAHSQVLALIGSKEGIAHIPLAFINPGEAVLVPNPGYPVYQAATYLAGGVPLYFALKEENNFLPDFSELEKLVKSGPKVKLMFLNYPNNPSAACASLDFFKEVVDFAKKHQIIVCHDNAYSEIYFNGKKQVSFLQVPGAIDVGCEFHSLSKTFNMTGWRVGFAVGNTKIIHGLAQVKTNVDSGIFNACQEAGIAALKCPEGARFKLLKTYEERRNILVPALRNIGLQCRMPDATFYVWAKLPPTRSSSEFALELIKKHGIVCTPGNGFGTEGEGFVRFTFCTDVSTLREVETLLKGG